MARILPSDIIPLALAGAGAHSGELQTMALLRAQLGPEYAALHSVHWSFSQGQGTRFGEIDFIRDEGQEFKADWLEILKLFLAEDGRILWLDDPDHNLLDKPPVELPGFVHMPSRQNDRSPYGIACVIRRLLPFDFEPANPRPRLGVGVHTYREAEDQARHLDEVVGNLISQGFSSEEIVILSLCGVDQSPLWAHEHIGRHPIRRFTGAYQPDGAQIWTNGDITLDSLYRFKEQDAPAVILTNVEDRKTPERLNRFLYCGLSGRGCGWICWSREIRSGSGWESHRSHGTNVSDWGVELDRNPPIGNVSNRS